MRGGNCRPERYRMLARLKYDPFKFFDESPSIYGPLAKKRIKEKWTDRDQEIVDQFVERMKESQEADGSWHGAGSDTVRTLDLLRALQVPKSEAWIQKSIDWLLAQHNGAAAYRQGFFSLPESAEYLTPGLLPTGEAISSETSTRHIYGELALAVLLRWGERGNSAVQTALAAMRGLLIGRYSVKGYYCCGACTASMWQVYGAMPQSTSPRVITEGLDTLKQNRSEDGTWNRFPFYFTLWSLSRLPYQPSRREIRYALDRLKKSQRADGGFGQSDREAKSYAVVAALSVL